MFFNKKNNAIFNSKSLNEYLNKTYRDITTKLTKANIDNFIKYWVDCSVYSLLESFIVFKKSIESSKLIESDKDLVKFVKPNNEVVDAYLTIGLIEFLIILKGNKNFQDKLTEISINYEKFENIIIIFFSWDEEIKRIYHEGLEITYNWQYGSAEVAASNYIYNSLLKLSVGIEKDFSGITTVTFYRSIIHDAYINSINSFNRAAQASNQGKN